MQTQKNVNPTWSASTTIKVRPATAEEDDQYTSWIKYAYHFLAAIAYSQLPEGGMVLVRRMIPFDLIYLTREQTRAIGPKEAAWLDDFDRETIFLIGFLATDGTLATYRIEGVGEAAPGVQYRDLTKNNLYPSRNRKEVSDGRD